MFEDGKDHINIYSKGETTLGRLLSNFHAAPFKHPIHGPFTSIEGYWYWLTTRDGRLRGEWGYHAKKLGQSLPKKREVLGFEKYIKEALTIKLNKPSIEKLLKETKPTKLKHYYVSDDGKIFDQTEKNQWWIDHIMDHWKSVYKGKLKLRRK
jgi:hypothetical protein